LIRLPGKADAASLTAAVALESDPFYRAIAAGPDRPELRQAALAQYFEYSIREGREAGRCVQLDDPGLGVAVWLLPQPADRAALMATKKRAFLADVLAAEGVRNYYQIVTFMHSRAQRIVAEGDWYLSIVAVNPAVQGQGIGAQLLAPTLAEADRHAISCYLETFSPRSHSFYERLGFKKRAQFREPTTDETYTLMIRAPA